MNAITVVVGLCASGKSMFSRKFSEAHPGCIVFDDFLSSHSGSSSRGLFGLMRALRDGAHVLANEPVLCLPENRLFLVRCLGVSPAWIFYENDPSQCLRNADLAVEVGQSSAHRRDIRKGLIDFLTTGYVIPDGHVAVPVWRPEDVHVGSGSGTGGTGIRSEHGGGGRE